MSNYILRIESEGLFIPREALERLLKGDKKDLVDFSPGKQVVLGLVDSESGTEITIARDRRISRNSTDFFGTHWTLPKKHARKKK